MTAVLSDAEIDGDYEKNTGDAIVRRYGAMDPMTAPGVLVAGHGPFAWGTSPAKAAQNAALLEEIAAIAYHTAMLNPQAAPLGRTLHDGTSSGSTVQEHTTDRGKKT